MISIHGFGHKMIADLDKCHDMFSFRSGVYQDQAHETWLYGQFLEVGGSAVFSSRGWKLVHPVGIV